MMTVPSLERAGLAVADGQPAPVINHYGGRYSRSTQTSSPTWVTR